MSNTIAIETAYNVSVNYNLANVWDRIWAFIIDNVMKIVYLSVIIFLLSKMGVNTNIIYVAFALPVLFYSLIFETINNGKTPGKSALNIQVVSLDGKNLSFGQLAIRWIMRILDFWIFSFSIAFLSVVSTRKAQRIGDIVANTTVITTKEQNTIERTSKVRLPANYRGVYKQVLQLKNEDIELIKQVVKDRSEAAYDLQVEAAKHLQEVLEIEKDLPSKEFLKTLVYDYNYFLLIEEGLYEEE